MIKLKEITKYYYSDSSVTLALKDINLEFKKGEFVAITGKSGSGKSTLINIISGMDTYEEGELYFRGMETSYYDEHDWELYRRNNISFVYQSYNLIDSYTALQNVETVMMLCENDDNRRTRQERKAKAMEMLKKVGLEKQAHNKASHMSSGQKQRLGIARALAKDTDVIIADEPTGNLDVENGKAIMAILHELSKEDKLVLVVTHNYEQAEPFVTRKIRLFDGEVVEDVKIDENLYEGKDFQSDYTMTEAHEEKEAHKTFSTARMFVKMSRFAQPHRTLFLFTFLLASALATLIFVGNFISSMDDYKTRNVSTEVFANRDDTRLLVKRLDGTDLTKEDYTAIADISRVDYVEKYDDANDWYYFAEEGVDYKKNYKSDVGSKTVTIEKLNYDHFLKSDAAISEEDLKSGRLPESMYEVVIYDTDDSRLGETMEIYAQNFYWSANYYIGEEFTIVGILKKESDQIYFDESFLKACDYGSETVEFGYYYQLEEVYDYYDENQDTVISYKDRRGGCKIYISDKLTGNQALPSSAVTNTLYPDGTDMSTYFFIRNLMPDGSVTSEYEDGTENEVEILYVSGNNLAAQGSVQISEELYYEIMGENDMTQASVFIEDYAYTDSVISRLNKEGYEVISVFRVSTTTYDSQLVLSRMKNLLISAAVIIIIFVLDILVIYLIMKLKRGDFIILKSLGMKQQMAGQMNYYELTTLAIAADIAAIIAGYVCGYFHVPLISEIMKYFNVGGYLVVIIINVLMAAVTARFFNRYLGKRFRLTAKNNG